jgi:NTP pyrophosphatase (non-canonical NTP hydrolase)
MKRVDRMLPDRLVDDLLAFRHERDWEQFHSPKNLAIAISVEAGELLEHFQWTGDSTQEAIPAERLSQIASEVADVVILVNYLAHDLKIDIEDAVGRKLAENAMRYPIDKSRGSAVKYDKL